MGKVTIEIPDDCELVQTSEGKWEQRKIERKLPKTWKEFCETHLVTDKECYVNNYSDIVTFTSAPTMRNPFGYRNLLPNLKTAKAMLALCQLIQLRNCYNGDWEPDWEDSEERKYVIIINDNKIESSHLSTTSCPLAFRTEGLRDQFLENFRDLIEIAKPLI